MGPPHTGGTAGWGGLMCKGRCHLQSGFICYPLKKKKKKASRRDGISDPVGGGVVVREWQERTVLELSKI